MAFAGRGDAQFPLRFPSGMRDVVKAAAVRSGRSMNSEIIFQLAKIYGAERKTADEREAQPAV